MQLILLLTHTLVYIISECTTGLKYQEWYEYYCRYYCFIINTNSHCLANKTVCGCQVLFLCVCLFVLRVWWSRMHARARTHTHIRTYAHTHTHTRTNTHKCMHTCTHSYVRTCTHMHTHTCTRSKFVTFDSAEPPFVICFLVYYETHESS